MVSQRIGQKERWSPSKLLGRIIEASHWKDTLSDSGKIIEKLGSEKFGEFVETLTGLNSIVTKRTAKKGEFADVNKSVGSADVTRYNSTHVRDRDYLLQQTHAALIQLLKQNKRREAGFLLYSAIQCIHPFIDGNGRTGRAAHYLLSADPKVAKRPLSEFIDDADGNQRVGRRVFSEHLIHMKDAQKILDQLVADDELGKEFRDSYGAIILHLPNYIVEAIKLHSDRALPKVSAESRGPLLRVLKEDTKGPFNLREVAILRYLQSINQLDRYQDNQWGTRAGHSALNPYDRVKTQYSISPDFFDTLSEKGAIEIVKIYYDLKKKMMLKLIDVVMNPRKFPDRNNPGRNILDSFYTP